MHEFSIMTYLLEAVEDRAREHDASKVLAINLTLGERAGIDDSLLFYFDELTPGTVAEGASLNITRVAMSFDCVPCGCAYRPSPQRADFACPQCGVLGKLLNDGTDLTIDSIEIES